MTNSWVNWAGDQRCAPAQVATPADVDELADVVAAASAAGRRVRVAGAGHSFTDAVLTAGVLVSLEKMNRVVAVDLINGRVRVEAGITLRDLNIRLHAQGRALPNLGDIDKQSLAGATATGTHGTGALFPNLSAGMHSVELVRADGSRVEVNATTDPDAWRAARVSVGALGVVSAITLETVSTFVLEAIERPTPLDAVLAGLDSYIDGNEHFEFYMFAHSPIALTKRNNRTHEPANPPSPATAWVHSSLLQNHALEALCRVGKARPTLIPRLNRFAARVGGYSHRVDHSHRVFCTPRRVRMTEMEYAIPREHAVEAIRRVKAVAERSDLAVPFPIEVRWVASDDAFLSPATGRDTCYIAVHMYAGMPWETYFRAVEDALDEFDARPHWGKRHFRTAETLAPRYPDWDRFADVRKRFDPDGVFVNDYTARVLGI